LLGDLRIPTSKALLNRKSAAGRGDGAGEFGQDAIAHCLDDAPVVTGHGRLDQLAHVCGKPPEEASRSHSHGCGGTTDEVYTNFGSRLPWRRARCDQL
jgi:hypothetical protein